jgi:hypothetical protein
MTGGAALVYNSDSATTAALPSTINARLTWW